MDGNGASHIISLSRLVADAAESTSTTGTQGATVAIALAAIAAVGTVATALSPTLVELVKNRIKRAVPPGPSANADEQPKPAQVTPATSNMIQSANEGLNMIEAAVLDARTQRDQAVRRAYDQEETIRRQAVYIAQLEGRLDAMISGQRYSYPPPPPTGRDPR